jgi:hypothetical protein
LRDNNNNKTETSYFINADKWKKICVHVNNLQARKMLFLVSKNIKPLKDWKTFLPLLQSPGPTAETGVTFPKTPKCQFSQIERDLKV